TTYWSFNLSVKAEQGSCELLQVCSEEDFERLQQNLIGHLLMKQRLKQPPTLFFGLTDEDDFILSVDNASGEVVLEQVGKLPTRCLAPDLATFIDGLTPAV
ncbi:MAG TPA: SecY-interacting protein, partial [Alteromonas sp.]|nr:SecY-interacting protein [Alteromonas sp.]